MNKQKLEYIDFAKGFAILSIVIFHYSQSYVSGLMSKAIQLGGTGVHLFFVLSGFGLALSYHQKTEISEFYKKRFTKILIPYYLIIISIYLINSIYPLYKDVSLYALGGHLFLYKMFDEKIIFSFGYHFWFISTIVQLYIVFPLIMYLKDRTTLSIFVAVSFFISLSYWVIITVCQLSTPGILGSFFLQYLWEFNVGIFLADLYRNKEIRFWEQNNIILALLFIVGIAVMGFMVVKWGQIGRTFNDVPAAIGYISLSCLIYSVCKKIQIIKNIVIYVGKLSYELYLVHMLVFILLTGFISKIAKLNSNIFLAMFFILPISIMVAHLLMLINTTIYKKSYRSNDK